MDASSKTPGRLLYRWIRRLFLAVLVLYALVCIAYATFQRRLIYVPPHLTAAQVDAYAANNGLERWKNPAGQAIGMKRLSTARPAIARVLIFYGAGGSTIGSAHYVNDIQGLGPFDVFILEYPGYADRAGSPSQQSFFDAAGEARQALGTNQPVYLMGESLGTGVATYLAGTHPDQVAGMILLSPYNCLTDVAQFRKPFLPACLLLLDRFPSEDYLRNYRGPVGFMVDGLDDIVPEKFGLRLFDSYSGPKQLWRLARGQHVSIPPPAGKFWTEVTDFWRTNQFAR